MPEPRCWVTEWRTSRSTPVVEACFDGPSTDDDGTLRGELLHCLDQLPQQNGLVVVGRVDREPGARLGVCSRPFRDEDRLACACRAAHEDHVTVGVIVEAFLEARPADRERRHGRWRSACQRIRAHPCHVRGPCRWSADGSVAVRASERCDKAERSITVIGPPHVPSEGRGSRVSPGSATR